jgi:DNA-binding MarR family transcriptional regulator
MLTIVPTSTSPSAVRPDASVGVGLASELRLAVMRLRRRLATEHHPDNELSISQTGVLAVLNARGDMTIGELAAWERVQPPSMTRTINCLAEAGFVERRAHESDGRIVLVAVTDAGRAVLAADRDRRDAWLARRLDDLTDAERDVLRRAAPILQRLAQKD